jgi:DNA-binding MarR family transcriptional regulator
MSLDETVQLQQHIQRFIRSFGALEQNKTPCGFPMNLTQAHALQEISLTEGITQQQLADKLMIDKSTVSRIIETFVRKGFVQRTVNPNNRRETILSLTAQGARIHAKIDELRKRKYRHVLDGIPDHKRAQVLEALEYLNKSLGNKKEIYDAGGGSIHDQD